MKRLGIILYIVCAWVTTVFAQDNVTTEVVQPQMDVYPGPYADSDSCWREPRTAPGVPGSDDEDDSQYLNGMVPIGHIPTDSLHLPTAAPAGASLISVPAYGVASPWGWQLHEGLNASVDLSVFGSFGRGHFSGTSERISAIYAKALTKNLSLAVGGYFQNMNSSIGSMRNAGLSAVLSYRFDEHWQAYVYAQKSLTSNGSFLRRAGWGRYPALWQYDMFGHTYGDRIGAGVQYNFNESTWIEVQVDWTWLPNDFHDNLVNRNLMPDQTQTGRVTGR